MTDFRTLISVAYDTKKANEELNREIKSLQDVTQVALDVTLSDTEAKNSIKEFNKLWSNYRKEAVSAITAPNTELQKMGKYYKDLEKDIQSELQTKKKYYLDELEAYRVNEEMKRKEMAKTSNLQFGKTQLDGNISLFLKENTRLGTELRAELVRIQSETKNADSVKLDDLQKQFKNVKLEAEVAGQTGANFFTRLKSNAKQFGDFLGSATLVMASINAIKGMVKEVKNLDSAMTELRKVTDETSYTYEKFLDTAANISQRLGASISDVVNMTSVWAKLGYTIQQASELAQISAIYANVGDISNTDTAVSDLVTTMKAFNIESDNAITIVDKLNNLGNKFAVSSADLGEGLKNSASSLQFAGNSLEQTIAILSGGGEITQNVAELGNAMKVSALRLQGMKGALQEINEEYENIESVSKIQTQIYNLTKGTVNIMNDTDPTKFKSTYEILEQIAGVYNDISQVDQSQLLELAFGKNRANQGAAVLQAFQSGQIQKALKEANDSAGSAMKEQEAYAKSIQYSIDRLSGSFQELSKNTINSQWIKLFYDLSNIIVQVIDKVGLFNVALIALAGTLNAKSGLVAIKWIGDLTTKMIGATGAATTLGFAMSAILPVAAIIGGITLVVKAYDHFNVTLEEQIQKYEDSVTAYKESSESLKSVETELENVSKRMDELNSKDNPTFVENGELEKLKNVTEELLIQQDILSKQKSSDAKSLAKEAVSTYNKQFSSSNISQQQVDNYVKNADITGNNALLFNDNKDISSLIAGYVQLNKLKQEAFDTNDTDSAKRYNEAIESVSGTLNSNILELMNLKSALEDIPTEELAEDQKFALSEINDAIGLIYENIDPTKWKEIKFDTLISSSTPEMQKSIDKLKELSKAGELSPSVLTSTKEYSQLLAKSELTAEDLTNQVNALVGSIKEQGNVSVGSQINWSESSKEISDYQNAITKIGSTLKDIGKLSSNDILSLMQEFPQLAKHGYTGSEGVETLEKALKGVAQELTNTLDPTLQMNGLLQQFYNENINASNSIDTMIESVTELHSALENVRSKQSMNLDEVAKLTTKYPELAKAIIITADGYSIEEDALKSLIQTHSGDANAAIAAQIDKTNNVINQTRSRIEAYKAEASAIDVLVRAYDSQYESMRHFLQEWGDEEAKSKFGASNVENYREYMKNRFDLGTALNELDKLKGQLSTSTSVLTDVSTKKEKKEKDFSKEYNWISILKDNINSALKGLGDLITYTQKNDQIDIALSAKLDEEKSLKEIQNSYLALADKVQLPDKYKKLVNEGALNVEAIADEALANKIDEYTKWKDAAKEVGLELEAIGDDLKELNGLKLDNIKSHFDVKESYTNSKIDKRNSLISSKEAGGGTASKADYRYLQTLYGNIIENLDKEYKAYETLFNEQVKQGIVRKGSSEYYEGLSYLNELTIATREANIQVDELATKKIKLTFVSFDKEIENVNKQLSEIDTMTSFVDKDSIEQITLYQTGLALASQHSKELTDEINKLNKSFSKGVIPESVYKERLEELESQMNSNSKAIQSYQNSIISSMKSRYDDELKLSDKALKAELKNLEKLKKAKTDALNDELKKYKEIIDLRKKALQDAIDEEDYQSEVADYTKQIGGLESRIARLKDAEKSGDLSARQERLSAEDELAKLKKDLGKLQRDYTVDNAVEALDAEYDEYEKIKNQQITDTESFYDLQIEKAQSVYDTKAEQLETLYANERQLIIDAAKLTSDEFSKAFNVINSSLAQYGMSIPSDLAYTYKELGEGFANNTASTDSVSKLLGAKIENNKYNQDTSELSGLNKYLAQQGYKTMTTKQMVELARALGLTDITSASQLGTDKIGQSNKNRIKEALMNARFSEGGIIGSSSIKAMGEDGLILVRKDEGILKENQWQLLRSVAEGLQSVNNSNLSKINVPQSSGSTVNVDINLPANSTITPDALKDLSKFKKDIAQEVSKLVITGSKKY